MYKRQAEEIADLPEPQNSITISETATFSPDGTRIVTTSMDKTAQIWDSRFATTSTKDLLVEVCTRRLRGQTTLRRDEMSLAGYANDVPEIDVCAGVE